MRLFIVSGTSGAGKSTLLHSLEDSGFYCIDNLPLALLPAFAQQMVEAHEHPYEDAAVGIDARNLSRDLSQFPNTLSQLKALGIDCRVVFIDADDEVLIKRFSETRRRHPLADGELSLAEAIREERRRLEPVSSHAELVMDSTATNLHQLRREVQSRLSREEEGMSLLLQSFGFKHGVPVDADYIFDVRCLPNPHWEPRLRPLTGRDEPVAHFLENHFEVNRMFEQISEFLGDWLPQFEANNRSYMTVAIGCTGGQHRSVYFVERLARHMKRHGREVLTRHRELS